MTRVVLCAEGAVEPTAGIERYLHRWPPTADDPVRLLLGVRRTPLPRSVVESPHVSFASFVPGRGLRAVGEVAYERLSYREICGLLLDGGLDLDGVVVATGAQDEAGRRHLVAIDGYLQLAVNRARRVVIEEHPTAPVVAGSAWTERTDDIVRVQPGPATSFAALSGQPDPVSAAIAGYVAGLLPDRAHLALGVGRVAEALAEILAERDDLTLVTGALTDAARRLDAAGALLPDALIQAMSVVGDSDLVAWAATHPRVRLSPSTVIHDPAWLGRHDRLFTVLGALNVDTEGNVNSETAGARLVSGLGGAPDLARGAALSRCGQCVVALPSRDRDGALTLRATVEAVSVPGRFVTAVVTERGVVRREGNSAGWERPLREIF
ncbi:acetyl-CoA hydrolase/transferase C-terminal domain-containing protein [Saccharopolyspora spinosa]|uniref:Acyl-CoA hydrolase n=1 Tax=Saccharopolyspora spinosa TaxID=60894 RepID=A0A2N3Y3G8_SACSN|nr:acetyl-CoA hydrolase/transferase C-terminal domain-containing protein [Saccharopolyspora spinosa]PKW17465.1 acyl-CoA hydrolase [Saccharopolyspora spinosa]